MRSTQTWKVYFKDGTYTYLYCKKEQILDNITARQYLNMDRAEILNRGDDTVNHKPILPTNL